MASLHVSITLDARLLRIFDTIRHKEKRSRSNFIALIIEDYLRKNGNLDAVDLSNLNKLGKL